MISFFNSIFLFKNLFFSGSAGLLHVLKPVAARGAPGIQGHFFRIGFRGTAELLPVAARGVPLLRFFSGSAGLLNVKNGKTIFCPTPNMAQRASGAQAG